VGGAGNGVQWVAVVSAVQELTAARMQARVLGTLESAASATPGIGYLLGGAIASIWSPRATFLVAGAGVIAIVLAAAMLMGRNWPLEPIEERPGEVDAADEIMVELIPAEALPSPERRM
jgi:MFS family permease